MQVSTIAQFIESLAPLDAAKQCFMTNGPALTTITRQVLYTGSIPHLDYHIHSLYSDGKDSIESCIRVACKRGLQEIAFTDHVWRTSNWVADYVAEIKRMRAEYPQIRILIGVEAKAIDHDGNVDVSRKIAQMVDFVMGVVHRYQPRVPYDLAALGPSQAARQETLITLKLLENPQVTVVGHPTRTYYKFFYPRYTQDPFPDDLLDEIAVRARECGKLLELNCQFPYQEQLLASYLRNGVEFTLGSDAHRAEDVGNTSYGMLLQVVRTLA